MSASGSAGRTSRLSPSVHHGFRRVETGTEVTYAADFTFKGPARFAAPLLRPALERLGQQAQSGLYQALNKL